MVLNDLKDFLKEYSIKNDWIFIVETNYGLNVIADEDIKDFNDKDVKQTLFLNISLDGNFEFGNWFLTKNHNVELGFFKKWEKSDCGENYFEIETKLLDDISLFLIELNNKFEVSNFNYTTGIDNLDSNQVAVKLNFTLNDKQTIC